MRIVDIRETAIPIKSDLKNSSIDFSEMTTSVVAVITDVVRDGKKVTGFACHRSEVSGRRLWGLFHERFGQPERFFAEHLVHNYCPLLFLENTKLGRNAVPEELPAEAIAPVNAACDRLLRVMVESLGVTTVVGVGGYAEERARVALEGLLVRYAKVPHPSPANPVANRGWSAAATKALVEQGVWA